MNGFVSIDADERDIFIKSSYSISVHSTNLIPWVSVRTEHKVHEMEN